MKVGLISRKIRRKTKSMDKKANPDNDALDLSEEHFRNQSQDESDEPYFPLEESKPPHY